MKSPAVLSCSPASSSVFAPCRDIDWRAIAVRVTGVLPRGCSNASLHTIQSQERSLRVTQPRTHTPDLRGGGGEGPTELDQSRTAGFTLVSYWLDIAGVCSGEVLLINTHGDQGCSPLLSHKLLLPPGRSWFDAGPPPNWNLLKWHFKRKLLLFESTEVNTLISLVLLDGVTWNNEYLKNKNHTLMI